MSTAEEQAQQNVLALDVKKATEAAIALLNAEVPVEVIAQALPLLPVDIIEQLKAQLAQAQ